MLYETPAVSQCEAGTDSELVSAFLSKIRNSGRKILTEFESKHILESYGIPTVITRIARTEEDAAKLAKELGFPVVLKINSETITHKTDVGGVQLNLHSESEVRNAFKTIRTNVAAKTSLQDFLGVTVQPMVPLDGYETILGSSIDPQKIDLPELGRNAVHAMARVVDLLQTDYAAQLSRRRHALLGCATISVGAICGGSQANIVPDRCTILIDRRSLPGETEASVRREILGILRRTNLTVTFTKDRLPPCLPLETDPRHPLVARFLKTAGQHKPVGVRYFCDASVFGHGGIPSVVFGPGDIAQAHTANEWISLVELERGKGLLLRFLQSFS